jgi:hypothetical protein
VEEHHKIAFISSIPFSYRTERMIRVLLILACIFALGPTVVQAAASICADVPCTMNMSRSCAEVLRLQLVYGSCCSLSDAPGNANDCLLTIAGNNTDCYMRSPDYVCIPENGCLPEWNVVSAITPFFECPPTEYTVPTEMPEDDTGPMNIAMESPVSAENSTSTSTGQGPMKPRKQGRGKMGRKHKNGTLKAKPLHHSG